MDYTILFNSGGNHGHQIKDALGGLAIGDLLELNYVHTPYSYLDFFGIGYGYPTLKKWHGRFKYSGIKKISGPLWAGIDDYGTMRDLFARELHNVDRRTLLVFDKALRVHPFQTIPWFNEGKLAHNIFSKLQEEVSNNFAKIHSLPPPPAPRSSTTVAVHINRGVDFDREKYPNHFASPFHVRYMFNLDYYENIMEQIEKAKGIGNVEFTIYTEELNSEEISARFDRRPNTRVAIGKDRDRRDNDLIHSIFKAFVESDILVCSNSSFSVMCAYFQKGRKTIYHPHRHLNHLPEPEYVKTKDNGDLDIDLLRQDPIANRFVSECQYPRPTVAHLANSTSCS